tara:strand:- start:57 stop:605 length:549 start_codon:yes stop_codon:yes gene_type:complete
MKSNLVKILGTLGLIIAIAVILKSVFGIGNIGFKSLTNKNIIIFDKCWSAQETNSGGKTYVDYKNRKDSQINGMWENKKFEIDLENIIITLTVTATDLAVKEFKESSLPASKIYQEKIDIEVVTDQYIRSVPVDNTTRTGKKIPGRTTIYVFNLNTKTIEKMQDDPKWPQTNILKCDEILGL